MGVDENWFAIEQVVNAGLRDGLDGAAINLSEREIEGLSETITDHLCGALAAGSLVTRERRRPFRRRSS